MGKSYQDYDRKTGLDRFLSLLKVFLFGFLGTLVGSLPVVILLCFFDVNAGLLQLLTGCGCMVFYSSFLKAEERWWPDHLLLPVSLAAGVFFSQLATYMLHYAPLWDLEGRPMNRIQKTFFAYFRHAEFDRLTAEGLITNDGALSVYTVLISSFVIALIGMYATFLFVLASGKEKHSGKKNKTGRKGRRDA